MQFLMPITTGIYRPAFYLALLAFLIGNLLYLTSAINSYQKYGFYRVQSLRLHTFDINVNASGTNLEGSLRLLNRDCEVRSYNLSQLVGKSQTPTQKVAVTDGLFLCVVVAPDKVSPVSIRFVLEGLLDTVSDSGEPIWTPISAADLRWARTGVRFLGGAATLPPGGGELRVANRPPWPWIIAYVVEPVLWMGLCLGCIVGGLMGRAELCKTVAAGHLALLSASHAVALAGYAALGRPREAAAGLPPIVYHALLLSALAGPEQLVPAIAAAAGLLSIVGSAIIDWAAFDDPGHLRADPPVLPASLAALGLYFLYQRNRLQRRCISDVVPDIVALTAAWAGTVRGSADAEALRSLAELSERLPVAAAVRHYHRLSAERSETNLIEAFEGVSTGASAEVLDAAAATLGTADTDGSESILSSQGPEFSSEAALGRVRRASLVAVTSLDQLYAQALTLAPIMAGLCNTLATESGGRLDHPLAPFISSSSAASTAAVDPESSLGRWVQRRWVKAPERAAEKVLLCYGGDVSRLVDVCRCRIVLDGPAAVLDCAKRVLGDGRLRVLGTKDLMNGDPSRSAGFRAFIIYLVLNTPGSVFLGIDNHTFELQLITSTFAADQNPETHFMRHTKYLSFRTARACRHGWHENLCLWLQSAAQKRRVNPWFYPDKQKVQPDMQTGEQNAELKGGNVQTNCSVCVAVDSENSELTYSTGGILASQATLVPEESLVETQFSNAISEDRKSRLNSIVPAVQGQLNSWQTLQSIPARKGAKEKRSLHIDPCNFTQHRSLLSSVVTDKVDAAAVSQNHSVEYLEIGQSEFDQHEQGAHIIDCLSEIEQHLGETKLSRKRSSESVSFKNHQNRCNKMLDWNVSNGNTVRQSDICLFSSDKAVQSENVDLKCKQTNVMEQQRESNFGQKNSQEYLIAAKLKRDETSSVQHQVTNKVQAEELNEFSTGLSQRLMHVMLTTYLRSTKYSGGPLDKRLRTMNEAINTSSAGSAWFTSKPLASISSKRVFHVLFIILALYFLYKTLVAAWTLEANGYFVANTLRMSGLKDLGGVPISNISNILSFGLLADRCPISISITAIETIGDSVQISLGTIVRANGYYFQFSPGNQSAAPAYWLMEISTTHGGQWKALGASMIRRNLDGSVDLFPQTANQNWRNATILVDMRPTWPWILQSILLDAVNGFAWILFLIAAKTGRQHYVHNMMVILFVCNAVFTAAAAIGYRLISDWVASTTSFCNLVQIFVVIFGLVFREDKFFSVFFLYGVVGFCFQMLRSYVLYSGTTFTAGVSAVVSSNSFLALLLCCAAAFFRQRALRNASALVMYDKLQYDRAWSFMLAHPDTVIFLSKLKKIAESLVTSHKEDKSKAIWQPWHGNAILVKQLNQNSKPHANVDLGLQNSCTTFYYYVLFCILGKCIYSERKINTLPIVCTSGEPLDSLDQLFAQAHLLAPILQVKVANWARTCGGIIQSGPPKATLSLRRKIGSIEDQSKHETELSERCESDWWPPREANVKGVSRSIEKIVRSYGQDVSRLVDVCRECIVFPNLEGFLACLEKIAQDPDTRVLRVKNRLDTAYNATICAGYRDLALNLQILNPVTKLLGIETHICELQLIFLPFASLKSNSGHKRYVIFRNLRAE